MKSSVNIETLTKENKLLFQQLGDYKKLFDSVEIAMQILDESGRFLDYNQAYYSLMGYTDKNQLVQYHPENVSPRFQPDGSDSFLKANKMIQIAFEQGKHSFEWMHRRSDGIEFLSHVTLDVINYDNQKCLRVLVRDISEMKKLERVVEEKTKELSLKNKQLLEKASIEKEVRSSLQKSNSLLKKLSNNIPAAIYQYRLYPDGSSSFPYASIGIEDIYEVTAENVMNDAQAVFDTFHPDDLNMVVDSINKSAEAMEDFNLEYRVNLPKKGLRWLIEHAKPEKLDDGSILWHGFIEDITDRKIIESKYTQQAQMIEQIHDSVISTDLEGIITSFNHGSELLLGYKADEIIGFHITRIYLEEDFEKLGKNIEDLKRKGESHSEVRLVKKSAEVIDVNLSLSLLKDEKGNPTGMVGYSQDITARKKSEKELEESNYNLTQYMDAIDKIDIGLFVVREDFTIEHMNKTMIKWFGDQSNKTCYSSVANLDEPCPYCKLHEVIYDNMKVIYEPTTPDGQSFDIVATSIKNSDGTTSKMEVIRNVTTQHEIKKQLEFQAHYDALTGLPNRVLFNDRLTQAIEKAKRNNSKFALLFIDLDHFKEINDSLGHDIGDDILKTVTAKLQDTIRDEDTISRLGGDEFTIILEDITQAQDASVVATKILETLSQSMNVNDNVLYVSSSIGISIFPDDGASSQDLLKFADSAMYKAKDEGRNNYQYYNSTMTELAFQRVVMETSLRNAIKEEEFVVYYQPQVNGNTNRLIGMEALVRWQHPTIGLVSPAKFIPLAETTGLIVKLDKFVMKTAMTQIAQWYKDGLNPGRLAMNLAVKQFKQENFIEMFQSLMKETGCKAEWIEFEVTEGQIMTNPEEAIKTLIQISDIGIELAIDDFGTGYSSLAYLKRLPIDKLKIDQAFVRDLPDDEEDAGITKAVIALAKSLNLRIIAEGVETKEQRDFIVENGCENIQGYYYSKPVPADDFELILKSGFKD